MEYYIYSPIFTFVFKKIILIVILGVLSIQIFPIQWIISVSNGIEFEQIMKMNDSEENDEVTKIIKDKLLYNDFDTNNEYCFELRNLVHNMFYISRLQKLCSLIISPPPNHV